MDLRTPKILFGKVMHGRLHPKRNFFTYGIYYVSLPLSKLNDMPLTRNKFKALSFYDRDHGSFQKDGLESWARQLLAEYNFQDLADGEIVLVCMPRVLGYVFNPVSFWLCYDKQENLRVVLSEVHNTFGENHTYLCANEDGAVLSGKQTLRGNKVFHVSPFLKREGGYEFRFDISSEKFAVEIDHYDSKGAKLLITSLKGHMQPMTQGTLKKAFWGYPLVTFKAVALIHWQAMKLLAKGVKYIHKPKQLPEKTTATESLTKL